MEYEDKEDKSPDALTLEEILKAKNVAELLDDSHLSEIGQRCKRGYEIDESSRSDWTTKTDLAMDIAKQTMKAKNTPFPGASNVKYPLITRAAIDFAARTYPEIVQGQQIVKASVMGQDPEGQKAMRADRVSKFMSWQLLNDANDWEEGTDKLLHILAVVGTVFRKTYYDPVLKTSCSKLCNPDQVVVNYNIENLKEARRITHLIPMYANHIIERQRAGLYLECDIDSLKYSEDGESDDPDPAICIAEQHCYLDLDEDGYHEPYIVLFHKESGKVLRIYPLYTKKRIDKDRDGTVKRIDRIDYFTDYHYIPSPDGGFYSLGLGHLLYPVNETVNTTLNQLLDSGNLANQQGGFIGRGLRIKGGSVSLKMGEWKVLDAASGTDIKNNIVPTPYKEPSSVLFQLLGLLLEAGKDLSSVQDSMQGKGQTQNVPATTILTMVEQGLKVFSAIQKRIYRSFKKEFQKLFDLNEMYLTDAEYSNVLDDQMAKVSVDFNLDDMDVRPVADPSASSDVQRITRAQAVASIPGLNPAGVQMMMLKALNLPEELIATLLPDPQAPPPPEALKLMAETEMLKVQAVTEQASQTFMAANFDLEKQKFIADAKERLARIQKMEADTIINFQKLENVDNKLELQGMIEALRAQLSREKLDVEASLKSMEIHGKTGVELEKVDVARAKPNNKP